MGEGKKQAWILLLWVPHGRGGFGGRGRGRAAHTHSHSLQYIPLMGGVCACVCVCLCVDTHTHTSPLTDPAQGQQSLQQGHLTLGNAHHGCFP